MRVLLVHNRHRSEWPSGEDVVFDAEVELLRSSGEVVQAFVRESDGIRGVGAVAAAAAGTPWSIPSQRALGAELARFRPDVVHVHNTFPLISPSAIWAAARAGCAVVVTLHNYRLFCAAGTFLRRGRVCEKCVSGPLPALRHRCYRGSRAATAPLAAAQLLHRFAGTWDKVHRFVVLTRFAREKFAACGLPAERMSIKPNFVPNLPPVAGEPDGSAVFLGRLSDEKGVRTLLEAWTSLPDVKLNVVGEGPLREWAEAHPAARSGAIRFTGRLPLADARAVLRRASFLVFPSVWYEMFPLSLCEAMAFGRPVLASKLGAAAELVEHGRTGLHVTPGDPDALVQAVRWAVAHPDEMAEMGRTARAVFDANYTAERNYELTRAIYREALETRDRP